MRFVSAILLTALTLAALACPAVPKSYDVNRLSIEAKIASDGSVAVTETVTYRFDGSYSYAYRDIPVREGQRVTDIVVSEAGSSYARNGSEAPGTYSVVRSNREVRLTWHYRASNERRTFSISYVLQGMVTRYRDVAEFYYKLVGEGWERPIGQVDATVRLPAGVSRDEVRAWAHGPLYGTVTIQSGATVRFQVSPLPAHRYWEARITMPARALSDLPAINKEMLPAIIDEETVWADEANRQREMDRRAIEERAERQRAQATLTGRLTPVAFVLAAIGLSLWFVLFRRYGWPYDVSVRTPPGEIPSDHAPAILSYLLFRRQVGPTAIVATLLDLAERGYVEIHETTTTKTSWFGGSKEVLDYMFCLGQKPVPELDSYERDLLDFLLNEAGDGSEFTMSGLKKAARKKRRHFRRWFMRWIKLVKEQAEMEGFYEPYPVGAMVGNALCGITIAGAGVLITRATGGPAGVPAIIGGGLQAILTFTLQRHTKDARALVVAWGAFRKHLKSIARALGPVTLKSHEWSRYMGAAVIFGMHKKLIPRLQMVDSNGHVVYPVWYYGALADGNAGISTLADGFSEMISAVSTTVSSASGAGGGASGGGGGGSGGGGGGAG